MTIMRGAGVLIVPDAVIDQRARRLFDRYWRYVAFRKSQSAAQPFDVYAAPVCAWEISRDTQRAMNEVIHCMPVSDE